MQMWLNRDTGEYWTQDQVNAFRKRSPQQYNKMIAVGALVQVKEVPKIEPDWMVSAKGFKVGDIKFSPEWGISVMWNGTDWIPDPHLPANVIYAAIRDAEERAHKKLKARPSEVPPEQPPVPPEVPPEQPPVTPITPPVTAPPEIPPYEGQVTTKVVGGAVSEQVTGVSAGVAAPTVALRRATKPSFFDKMIAESQLQTAAFKELTTQVTELATHIDALTVTLDDVIRQLPNITFKTRAT